MVVERRIYRPSRSSQCQLVQRAQARPYAIEGLEDPIAVDDAASEG